MDIIHQKTIKNRSMQKPYLFWIMISHLGKFTRRCERMWELLLVLFQPRIIQKQSFSRRQSSKLVHHDQASHDTNNHIICLQKSQWFVDWLFRLAWDYYLRQLFLGLVEKVSLIIMRVLLLILPTLLLAYAVSAAYCNGKPGQRYVNNEPIWSGEPRLLKKHQYGQLYEIGSGTTNMKLLHAYGTMYQMGLAQGVLLRDELNVFIHELWQYIEDQITSALPKKMPKFLQKGTANFALGTVLDLNYEITLPYTNKKYYEEMRGVADGSGVNFKYFKRVHMIGELTKGACSMFGAWGKATTNGQTIQLRALDWDFDGPYHKYPLAVVYHPSNNKFGNAWVNIGFMGWLGVLSGVNEHQLAVSEIGVSYPDASFGKQSRFGNPFTFVLRDVLQWDKTLNESIHRMKTTKRTCNLILGVGDGKSQFRSFQYSHSVCNVIDDKTQLPKQDWHPLIENAVYYGMDWLCPAFHQRLNEMISDSHGQITAEVAVRKIVPGLNSGNLQVVVYDLSYERVYFAFGHVTPENKRIDAYLRPFIMMDLKQAFAHKMT